MSSPQPSFSKVFSVPALAVRGSVCRPGHPLPRSPPSDPVLQATRIFGIDYPGIYDVELATFQVGGPCSYAAGLGYPATLTGKVQTTTHRGSRVMLKLTETPGVEFNFDGVIQSDGSITGTYTGGGAYCSDSGSFVAKPAVSLVRSYVRANLGCITLLYLGDFGKHHNHSVNDQHGSHRHNLFGRPAFSDLHHEF